LGAVDDRGGLVAHRLQRVLVIALTANREQVAIFGIKQKKQAIEQTQAGVSNFGPPRLVVWARVRGGLADRRYQSRVDAVGAVEDDPRQCLRDLLLVAPAFGESEIEEGFVARPFRAEGAATEQQHEYP